MRLVCLLLLGACATSTPTVRPAPTATPQATSDAPTARPQAQPGQTATQVLPGDSAGPVSRNTTHADLLSRLGNDSVSEQPIDLGEGVTALASVVYAGTDRELQVVWRDNTRTVPHTVHIVGGAWQLPEDLRVGDTLERVQERLGSVSFLGFGWDGEGTIVLEGTPLAKYADTLLLRFGPPDDVPSALMGSGPISADNSHAQEAGLILRDARIQWQ